MLVFSLVSVVSLMSLVKSSASLRLAVHKLRVSIQRAIVDREMAKLRDLYKQEKCLEKEANKAKPVPQNKAKPSKKVGEHRVVGTYRNEDVYSGKRGALFLMETTGNKTRTRRRYLYCSSVRSKIVFHGELSLEDFPKGNYRKRTRPDSPEPMSPSQSPERPETPLAMSPPMGPSEPPERPTTPVAMSPERPPSQMSLSQSPERPPSQMSLSQPATPPKKRHKACLTFEQKCRQEAQSWKSHWFRPIDQEILKLVCNTRCYSTEELDNACVSVMLTVNKKFPGEYRDIRDSYYCFIRSFTSLESAFEVLRTDYKKLYGESEPKSSHVALTREQMIFMVQDKMRELTPEQRTIIHREAEREVRKVAEAFSFEYARVVIKLIARKIPRLQALSHEELKCFCSSTSTTKSNVCSILAKRYSNDPLGFFVFGA